MDKKIEYRNYVDDILEKLNSINPKIVIVFGSYANNDLTEDSDLDLLIVLDDNRIPKSYDEKLEMKLKIRKIIREINREIAIDLLVYTIPEYEEFIKSSSSFSKEIKENGKIIYEKTSKAMA